MFLSQSRVSALVAVASIFAFLLCDTAHGQSNGDGSIYSRFGLGTLTEFSSSRADALGGGGYALRSFNYNPTGNPAVWSDQVFTRLSAGASYRRIATTGKGDRTSRLSSGNVEAVQFSFPLYKRTLGVGLSYQPFSQYNYRVRRDSSISVRTGPNTTEEVPYDINFRGTGGLHTFRGGLGYRLNDALSVGASVDVLFGILDNRRNTEFQSGALRNVSVSDGTRLVGVTGTFGSHLTLSSLLSEDDAFYLGASVALPATLSGSRVQTRGEGRDLVPDTLSSVDGEVSLPWRGRLGVAYQPNNRWTFTANGRYEPWSDFTSTFQGQGTFSQSFPPGGADTLTDRWRISTGAEVLPAGEDALSGFFSQIAYRIGGYYEHMYVRPSPASTVESYAVTGGLSFPTSLSGTRIDLNVEVGTTGADTNSLVQDTFYSVGLHVNFGERWFRERKLR